MTTMKRIISIILAAVVMLSLAFANAGSSFAASDTSRPGRVTGVKAVAKEEKITVSWGKAKNARKYRVYIKEGSGKWHIYKKAITKRSTTYTAKANNRYNFRIKGINKNGKLSKKYSKTVSKNISCITVLAVSGSADIKAKVGDTFTVKVTGTEANTAVWGFDDEYLDASTESGSSKDFTVLKSGKTVITVSDKDNTITREITVTAEDPGDPGDDPEVPSETGYEIHIISDGSNTVYNGGGSALTFFVKTNDEFVSLFNDWYVMMAPASKSIKLGYTPTDDEYDDWPMLHLSKGQIPFYDIEYKNAHTMSVGEDFLNVDGGYIFSNVFGNIIDEPRDYYPAGNYKLIVLKYNERLDTDQVVAISDNFKTLSYKTFYNSYMQDFIDSSKDILSCDADYSIAGMTYDEARSEALAHPELKRVLELSKYMGMKYEYCLMLNGYTSGSQNMYSMKDGEAQMPVIAQSKVCASASYMLIHLCDMLGITAEPKISSVHQTTIVTIDGKSYIIDCTPYVQRKIDAENHTIYDYRTGTTTGYDFITLP